MSRTLVINCINSDNFGDQEIGNQISDYFASNSYNFDIVDLALRERKYNYNLKNQNYRKITIKKQTGIICYIKKAIYLLKWNIKNRKKIESIVGSHYDCLIFGGGELIQSNYSFPRMIKVWAHAFLKENKNAKIHFLAVGVTSNFSKGDRNCFLKVFRKTESVYVRDETSKLNLKTVFSINSHLVPDVVYALEEPKRKVSNSVALYGLTSINRILRYNFSHISSINEYFEFCYNDLLSKYLNHKTKVILFYEDISDKKTCMLFSNYVKSKKNVSLEVANYETTEEFKELILSSKYVSSPRMHACIFGLLYGKEIEVIKISPKLQSFEKDYVQKNPPSKELLIHSISNLVGKLK